MVHKGLGEHEKTPGLVRRNGTYYARKRVPKLLVDSLGKREIKISLETKNFDEARAKLPAALLEIQKQMAAAKQTADDVLPLVEQLSRGVLEQIARGWFKPRWDATTESLWQPPPPGVAVEDELCNLDPILTSLMRPDEVTFGEYLYRARQLLATAGHPNASGASIEMLARYMIRGEVECLKASRRFIVDGQLFNVIEDPLYRPVGGSAEGVASFDASKAQNGITVDQAIEQFTNDSQRANLSRKNIKGYEPGFKLLREVAGGGRPLSAVTREHARRVLDVLAHLPANATKRFSGMTLLEAAEHAKRNGVPPISAKTAENILYNFSSFFRWAVREHIIERSPADGLKPSQKKRSKDEGRKPFSDVDLVKLFSADLYRAAYRQIDRNLLGRYWVPLLALYHGARLNELCQLEVADIGDANGIPFIRITEASEVGEDKKVKTRNAEREVPLHPILQQLGFLDYAAGIRRTGQKRLFPDLTRAATGYFSDNFSKWFGRFKKQQKVTDRRLNFHSFRHGFNDATRVADIPDAIVKELCGW
ncbi:site-specific integrase, partial [Burkholderia pseudomallei]